MAALNFAWASERVRASSSGESDGAISATVSPSRTASPGSRFWREMLPDTGADTTYRSFTLAIPVSSIATTRLPRAAGATSTGTGLGRSAQAVAAAAASARRARTH